MRMLLKIRSNIGMIACYGEALVDLIVSPYSHVELRSDSQACLGGSVFNFCLAAQRQGMQALYLNALSGDVFGRQFAKVLQKEGVKLDAQACREPTSIAVVQLDTQGKATYAFHREAVADIARSATEIIANWCPQVIALHTGCLMLTPSAWAQTQKIMAHAVSEGCVLSVDANLRLTVYPDAAAYVPCVLQACAMAHVVKVSDDDLLALGMLGASELADSHAVVQAARQLFNQSSETQLIALTLGERGAWLLTREHQLFQSALQGIKVADTVGAGDSFAAALLAYLNAKEWLNTAQLKKGLPSDVLQAALRHAVAAATVCVQRVGCDPATWGEAEDLASRSRRNIL
jgi:fructokinase